MNGWMLTGTPQRCGLFYNIYFLWPLHDHKLRKSITYRHWIGFWPPSATVVSVEPFSHGTGTLRCLQKEMATYRRWSVSLWQDTDNMTQTMSHTVESCPDKTEWRLISATLCGWRCCFVADQLRFMTRIQEEEELNRWQLHTISDSLWLSATFRNCQWQQISCLLKIVTCRPLLSVTQSIVNHCFYITVISERCNAS